MDLHQNPRSGNSDLLSDVVFPACSERRSATIPRILLIINYRNLLDSLGDFLTRNGYFVYGVSSSGLALEVLQCVEFDFVICDNYSPDICGPDVCRQIYEVSPGVKFMLMSGIDDTPPACEAERSGIQYIFRKPLNLDEILTILDRFSHSK